MERIYPKKIKLVKKKWEVFGPVVHMPEVVKLVRYK